MVIVVIVAIVVVAAAGVVVVVVAVVVVGNSAYSDPIDSNKIPVLPMFSEGSGAAAGVAWRRHVLRELRGRRSEYSLPGAAGACGRAQWPVGKESLGGDKSKGWTWLTMRKRSVFF